MANNGCNHEKMKEICGAVMEYYFVTSDTEYTLKNLNTLERIDVVGYYENKKEPDIGIEVECTSEFQKDASKLLKVPSFKHRFIVSPNPQTLALQNHTEVEIYNLPSEDSVDFERRIREITKTAPDRDWFFPSRRNTIGLDSPDCGDKAVALERFIETMKLNLNTVKSLLYRAYSGEGITIGHMSNSKYAGTRTNIDDEIPKEIHILKSMGIFFEHTVRTPGLPINLHLSQEAIQLASCYARKRIETETWRIQGIFNEYGPVFTYVALLGCQCNFSPNWWNGNEATLLLEEQYGRELVEMPSVLMGGNSSVNSFISEDPMILQWLECLCNFRQISEQVARFYERLLQIGIGVQYLSYHGREGSYDNPAQYSLKHIRVPLEILSVMDIKEFRRSLDDGLLRKFVSIALLLSDRTRSNEFFYTDIQRLHLDQEEIEETVQELSRKGICSPLIPKELQFGYSSQSAPFTILKKVEYQAFLLDRMRTIIDELLEK